ncbi:Inter-alpha-trypsin inhibitor heavy chain H4, partial [Lamprotornis superbus]
PAIDIYSLRVDCKVTSRFAHTVITSRIVNRANESREATFEVELPKTAFITNFSMSIDGEIYPGIIKEKAAAQNEYNTAVSQGQSAGLVKITDRKLEQFHVSVSIAAASKVTFELTYEELLKRQLGKYELLLKVRPKQLVQHFQIHVHIFEPQGIRFLETDSTFMTNELSEALTKEVNETKAHISFKPALDQQKKNSELDETLLNGDFVVRYDVKREATAGDIQIVNGYFVHYFAPQEMPVFPKNVIFVIDRSGSMTGRKIEQTRDALLKILQDLRPEDHFSFITFNNKVAEWKSSLLPATEENVASAAAFVQTLAARGGTDINGALLSAVGVLDRAQGLPEHSISMVILLTDGQPTSGERNVEVIQENVQQAINGKYALFCLGFGFDVSYKFLEKMALSNGGIARRIYENADAALQLQHTSNLTLKEEANVKEKEQVFQNQRYIFGNFIERLWAYLSIQQLLEKAISAQEEDQKALEVQALDLSLQYSFVTPLTSMVVTKPQQKEELANKPTEADNEEPDGVQVRGSRRVDSGSPPGRRRSELQTGSNRMMFSSYRAYEHPQLLLQLPRQNERICLNIDKRAQTSVHLVSDPEQDDFLGLYFLNTDRFSDQVTGVLGQFYSKAQFESNSNNDQRAVERLLRVSGSEHKVSRLYKKDYRLESTSEPVSCWSIDLTP